VRFGISSGDFYQARKDGVVRSLTIYKAVE
jgi:hypothetical protein